MYHVRRWDRSFADDRRQGALPGFSHCTLVDRAAGAIHTELGLCRIAQGAVSPRHVHPFEQGAYVLEGQPIVELLGREYQLEAGDYVLFPLASPHRWRNASGADVLLLEVSTPQCSTSGSFFDAYELDVEDAPAQVAPQRPPFGDPSLRYLGRELGIDAQLDALTLSDPARGRRPAGMDTAMLAYSGISVKMMIDPGLGADLLTMFMVDYEPGGAAQVHDHPFEEAYVFLQGEIEGEIEGHVRTFHAGEVLFCGVGVLHGFFNTSGAHVRWIETQAPQPPRRHSYRWPAHWSHLAGDQS